MQTLVPSPETLGRALRDARRGQGLTQARLAALAGVTQPMVSNVERGEGGISFATLLRLLAALQLELVLQDREAGGPTDPWQDER